MMARMMGTTDSSSCDEMMQKMSGMFPDDSLSMEDMASRMMPVRVGKKFYLLKHLSAGFLFIMIFYLCSCDRAVHRKTGADNEADSISFEIKTAEVYITAKGTDYRLAKSVQPEFFDFVQPDENFPAIILDADTSFQSIVGFGGCFDRCVSGNFFSTS